MVKPVAVLVTPPQSQTQVPAPSEPVGAPEATNVDISQPAPKLGTIPNNQLAEI